jgi:hypothetical protein
MERSTAQKVLIIAALMLLIEPLGDGWLGLGMLSENHVGSTLWPDHAKFHVIRQAFACIFTGLLCAWGLFNYWDRGRGVRLMFALIPFIVNASGLMALVLAPVWGVENPVSQKGIGGPAIILSMILTIVGLYLEARERRAE